MKPARGELAELARQVRQTLTRAGFRLVDEADEQTPGLRVRETASGAEVTWTTSDGFAALADRDHGRDTLHDGIPVANVHALVQAAVRNLLTEHGHIVIEASEDGDLVILASTTGDS